jgi:acyl-coenzyme A thioesterase PaaI-like protein
MKKLYNPHKDEENAICFACSPNNEIGLQMEFFEDGSEIISFWKPEAKYEGFENILHGGIQATLIDEIAAWTVFVKGGTGGVTKSIKVEYKSPVYINLGTIELRAKYIPIDDRHARIDAKLLTNDNQIATTGEVIYLIYPQKVARKKLNYPGISAFYKNE